jgi:phosphatidylserine decarboxylase
LNGDCALRCSNRLDEVAACPFQTAWHGIVNPPRTHEVREWTYTDQTIELKKGEEMGRFLLGSTVVMLFPQNSIQFPSDWISTRPLQMGEAMSSN